MKTRTIAVIALSAFAALTSSAALAEDVRVRTLDGTGKFIGTIQFVDAEYLIISTTIGQIQLRRDSIICEGAACPSNDQPAADVIARSSDAVGDAHFPRVITG